MQNIIYTISKVSPVLPFLTGAALVIAKFSEHAERLPWSQLGQTLLFSMIVSLVCWGFFFAIKYTRPSSGILGSVLVAITMLWMVFDWTIIPVAIILLAIALVPRLKKEHLEPLKSAGVIIMTVSCISGLIISGIVSFSPATENVVVSVSLEEKPNIYFIIPDRFPSHDALLESGYDNSEFIAYLEEHNYYTKDNQLSGDEIKPGDDATYTSRTPRYIASVLNLGENIEVDAPYNAVSRMIKYHKVGKILHENGYQYYHIGTWWSETEVNETADVNYVFQSQTLMPSGELPVAIMDRSIFRYLTTYPMQYIRWMESLGDVRRQQHLFQLESFKQAISGPEPQFVFVHLILPHPPYIWTADGQPQENLELTQMEQYLEQIKFAESFLKQFIEQTEEDDIVIIQSDEGMAFEDDELNMSLSNTQWNGVLTAWHIPGADEAELAELKHTEVLKYVINSLQ